MFFNRVANGPAGPPKPMKMGASCGSISYGEERERSYRSGEVDTETESDPDRAF
jgi:hypothetical protein